MAFILKATQNVDLSVALKDKKGNTASVQNGSWTSSDSSIVTLIPSSTGDGITASAVGPEGTASVIYTADSDLGEGVRTITGMLDIQVVAGDAAVFNITPSTPVEQADAAPVTAAPSAPVDPAAPSAPVDPAAPSAPVDPAAPSAPVDPAAPSAPADPAASSAPADTSAPIFPGLPSEAPVDPAASSAPVDAGTPLITNPPADTGTADSSAPRA